LALDSEVGNYDERPQSVRENRNTTRNKAEIVPQTYWHNDKNKYN
jgi:hypothetical protein